MKSITLISFIFCVGVLEIKAQQFYSDRFAHTYSIVARDSITGEMGVAVQSHWFSVGSVVSWAEAGIGAIATQSFVNPAFGPDGLKLLKQGKSAEEVVNILIEADTGRDVRQLAVLDRRGNTFAYTGKRCIDMAGHINGKNFSVQANMMLNEKVWPAMEKAFAETKAPLAERMLAALQAAQNEGGDIRGQQSASILVVKRSTTGKIWQDRNIDLRVEDHAEPIKELTRLLKIFRAYEHMNDGDLALEKNDFTKADSCYSKAEIMFPQNVEMKFWHAVALVNKGNVDEALPLFKSVFAKDKNWITLIKRLRKASHLNCTDVVEQKILAQANKQ